MNINLFSSEGLAQDEGQGYKEEVEYLNMPRESFGAVQVISKQLD